jgi:hypothetical protein
MHAVSVPPTGGSFPLGSFNTRNAAQAPYIKGFSICITLTYLLIWGVLWDQFPYTHLYISGYFKYVIQCKYSITNYTEGLGRYSSVQCMPTKAKVLNSDKKCYTVLLKKW